MIRSLLFFLSASLVCAEVPPRVLIEQYAADASLLSRHWSITGDTARSLDREQQMLEGWLKKLRALDFAKLTPEERIDFVLMRNDLEASLMRVGDRRDDLQELANWMPFRSIIDGLTEQRVLGTPLSPEKAASALAPLAKRVSDLQAKQGEQGEEAGRQKGRSKACGAREEGKSHRLTHAASGAACRGIHGCAARVSENMVWQLRRLFARLWLVDEATA